MWRKIGLLVVIVSIALNLAFVGVWASRVLGPERWQCPGPGKHEGDNAAIWCPLHRKLGVSEKQRKQVEPQLVEFRKSSEALCQEISRKRLELIDLMAAPQPDREAIRAKQQEILAGQGRMQDMVVEQLLSERKILSPQQQQELFELLRRQGGCGGHGPMMGVSPVGHEDPHP